ncbi:MAG: class I SAM-dependent methyltransferase [Pseudomonadota bacterium]
MGRKTLPPPAQSAMGSQMLRSLTTRGGRRTLRFGLQTILGLAERGFFIPQRSAGAAALWANRDSQALRALFQAAEPAFTVHLAAIDTVADDLLRLDGPTPEPRFTQTWFPRLDAAALYAFVRHHKPARVVEVGSGHSTRFLVRAIRDGALPTHLTAIDPQPRADLAGLPVTLERSLLQSADLAPIHALQPGDLLFIDSSHVLMPGTDVDIVLNHLVPALAPGVFVGFHDIFLPHAYPPVWPFTTYNEQNAVAPLLRAADLIFASAYVADAMADALANTCVTALPLAPEAHEGLLLMRLR